MYSPLYERPVSANAAIVRTVRKGKPGPKTGPRPRKDATGPKILREVCYNVEARITDPVRGSAATW